jgi:8-oxo-dGTP pyrophosphatase MutT (NUDIX family)
MRRTTSELAAPSQLVKYRPTWGDAAVDRVRCVLRYKAKFLLADHGSGRRGKPPKWGLVGGRIEAGEEPLHGVKRELAEELRLRVATVVELGDWWHRDENYRVYGAELSRAVRWFDERELSAIAWLTDREVAALLADGKLHKGFELDALREFQRRFPD